MKPGRFQSHLRLPHGTGRLRAGIRDSRFHALDGPRELRTVEPGLTVPDRGDLPDCPEVARTELL